MQSYGGLSSTLLATLFAAFIGCAFAVQTGINAQLRAWLGSPLLAAFISFAVGTLVLALILTVQSGWHWPAQASHAPKWVWVGGLLGAFIIVSSILLAPKLGSFALTALVVSSQVLTALFLDSRGLLGFARSPMTGTRILGAALIIVGLLLALRKPDA